MVRRNTPPELRKQFAELYGAGLSIKDVAERLRRHKSTVRYWLAKDGVPRDKIPRISAKAKGRPSPRKGATHTLEARAAMSRARRGRPPTTLGKVYTTAERANIAIGLAAHYAKLRAEGKLLTPSERSARASCRSRYKRLVRRLVADKAGKRTCELLGYSAQDFRKHIEAQFQPGMSWTERESFHVDHIVPIVDFIKRGIIDPKIVNALSNLQPLTRRENQTKHAQVLTARFNGGKATYTAGIV